MKDLTPLLAMTPLLATSGGTSAMAGGVAGGDGYQRAINLGVRHRF